MNQIPHINFKLPKLTKEKLKKFLINYQSMSIQLVGLRNFSIKKIYLYRYNYCNTVFYKVFPCYKVNIQLIMDYKSFPRKFYPGEYLIR